jgi:hypothetical protein
LSLFLLKEKDSRKVGMQAQKVQGQPAFAGRQADRSASRKLSGSGQRHQTTRMNSDGIAILKKKMFGNLHSG